MIVQTRALQAVAQIQPLAAAIRRKDYDLFRQLRRAMNSVVLNIAEAQGNDPGTGTARFASACGSAKEVRAALTAAAAWGYVDSSKAVEVDGLLDEICAMTFRLSGR